MKSRLCPQLIISFLYKLRRTPWSSVRVNINLKVVIIQCAPEKYVKQSSTAGERSSFARIFTDLISYLKVLPVFVCSLQGLPDEHVFMVCKE